MLGLSGGFTVIDLNGSDLIDREQRREIAAAVENANQKQKRRTRLKQDQVALMNTATDVKTKCSALGWLG
jgi:hypothetical protein